jgi:hypothetical protein
MWGVSMANSAVSPLAHFGWGFAALRLVVTPARAGAALLVNIFVLFFIFLLRPTSQLVKRVESSQKTMMIGTRFCIGIALLCGAAHRAGSGVVAFPCDRSFRKP